VKWIYGLGAHRVTDIPFIAGVATVIFNTAPKDWDSSNIHHPVTIYDSMVLYLHSLICSTVWSLMKHIYLYFFYKQMTLNTTLDSRMQEKCHNQWIHTNMWKGNNIISMICCSHIKTFPPLDNTESRRHKLYQKDPTHHQNDTISRVLFAQGGSTSYIHHNISTKSIKLLALE